MIHGRNFLLNFNGKWEKAGFYTPRYADAPDERMAEQVALEDFRHSDRYHGLLSDCLNAEVADDAPSLSGEDVEETTPNEDFAAGPPGFAFYIERDEGSAEPCAPPNGGPAEAQDNSGVTEGPPSVS